MTKVGGAGGAGGRLLEEEAARGELSDLRATGNSQRDDGSQPQVPGKN